MRYFTLIMMAACGLGCFASSGSVHAYTIVYGIDQLPQATVSGLACARKCESLCEMVLRERRGDSPERPAAGEWSSVPVPAVASGTVAAGYAMLLFVTHAAEPPLVGLIPDEAVLVPIRFLDGIFRPPRC
ncbi:hypothetical protein Mal4_11140 [Maioricimonas rarisocia]|uniref:Lipoprotein n=1 Tax=Maioricimonas rarisocia TaxID=2528026 RepID=A0A517Z2Z5_9PLAN|nr:hypothetical protein [Maioricimonas rarisocia]QDU36816.1 hypothetical protein Mal4_11140 [Maioricimonas rarisocia]